MEDEDSRTIWVGNLDSDKITEDVLYELFLQAGPLQCVRIPKDKITGRLKSFAFIIYREAISVPYAIELLNGIPLYNRNMRVQNRGLLELQQKGCGPGPGGIHTLNPNLQNEDPYSAQRNNYPPQMNCAQQYSLMGQGMPGLLGMSPTGMVPQSLMGTPPGVQPGLLGGPQPNYGTSMAVPAALRGQVPKHIMELAQQQIAMLQTQQPPRLSDNPLLNAPGMHMSDRLGTLNHGMYNQDRRNDMHGDMRRGDTRFHDNRSRNAHDDRSNYNRHHDRNRSSESSNGNYNHNDRNRSSGSSDSHHSRYEGHRGGGQKYIDNDSMKAIKTRYNDQAEDSISQNSHMLAHLQKQQGRFDYNRLGPHGDGQRRENGSSQDTRRTSHYRDDRRSHHPDSHHYSRSRGSDDRPRYDPYRSSRR